MVSKYQETPLSTLESFYFPGDGEDVENYGQALMDWTSDIRKHLIQLKAETVKILRDKEKESEIPKDWLLSEFLTYEQRLKNIYYSIAKFENWLKITYKPAPLRNPPQPSSSCPSAADTGRTSSLIPNDGVSLTERLDKVSLKHLSLSSLPAFLKFILDPQHLHYIRSLPSRILFEALQNT